MGVPARTASTSGFAENGKLLVTDFVSNWCWLWAKTLHRTFRSMNPGGLVRGTLDG
ncbi:hypothetical protein [Nocardia brasiliensis]|uniref:hypothetical protein n=1 Tax=Nocardia brasiliensis TaxID=37326 RepID=UPI00142E4DEE|nr:hypothetical protein [Nocardia brasiliensis]